MEQSSELERLAQLRANGTLSKKEFERKKREILFPGKRVRRGLWWKIPILIAAVVILLTLLDGSNKKAPITNAQQHASADTGQIDAPECSSNEAKQEVANVFADQPDTSVRLKFLDWKDVKQLSYDPKTKERDCQGYLIFNSEDQEGTYSFRFYYASPTSQDQLIAVKPLQDQRPSSDN
ncbi:SHOCT domain-containing protein [Acetobacteraceae bacterium KSS8]|uniref:SHOCT domain-containing protein n=1 Tax=Endosaccharibacter trunci TaxID=2812733 RepID=A0ABT1W956_9PROT|nr:SHOCT domain-containing protein [Acetobacteraceae bacterium KSS8]